MTTNRINAEVICLNCQHVIAENFCGNCGQKKYKRIDKKYLYDEFQYSVLHTNKGFFYSIKKILTNPGKTARDFVEGNRVNHYKPILLAFMLSTISAFLSYKVIGLNEKMTSISGAAFNNKASSEAFNTLMTLISSYSSFFMLAMIPVLSFCAVIAFMNWGHNYYEHIVMGAFISSLYTIVSIIFIYPIMYFVKDDPNALITMSFISSLSVIPLLIWFYKGFYKEKTFGQVLARVGFFFAIGMALYVIVIIISIIALFIFKGPEMMEMAKPKA